MVFAGLNLLGLYASIKNLILLLQWPLVRTQRVASKRNLLSVCFCNADTARQLVRRLWKVIVKSYVVSAAVFSAACAP